MADDPKVVAWVESTPLEQLIKLVSERVTHISLDWADGCCRAELRSGGLSCVGRGPRAQIALARAMMSWDHESRTQWRKPTS